MTRTQTNLLELRHVLKELRERAYASGYSEETQNLLEQAMNDIDSDMGIAKENLILPKDSWSCGKCNYKIESWYNCCPSCGCRFDWPRAVEILACTHSNDDGNIVLEVLNDDGWHYYEEPEILENYCHASKPKNEEDELPF